MDSPSFSRKLGHKKKNKKKKQASPSISVDSPDDMDSPSMDSPSLDSPDDMDSPSFSRKHLY
jgi:hypothetical protein